MCIYRYHYFSACKHQTLTLHELCEDAVITRIPLTSSSHALSHHPHWRSKSRVAWGSSPYKEFICTRSPAYKRTSSFPYTFSESRNELDVSQNVSASDERRKVHYPQNQAFISGYGSCEVDFASWACGIDWNPQYIHIPSAKDRSTREGGSRDTLRGSSEGRIAPLMRTRTVHDQNADGERRTQRLHNGTRDWKHQPLGNAHELLRADKRHRAVSGQAESLGLPEDRNSMNPLTEAKKEGSEYGVSEAIHDEIEKGKDGPTPSEYMAEADSLAAGVLEDPKQVALQPVNIIALEKPCTTSHWVEQSSSAIVTRPQIQPKSWAEMVEEEADEEAQELVATPATLMLHEEPASNTPFRVRSATELQKALRDKSHIGHDRDDLRAQFNTHLSLADSQSGRAVSRDSSESAGDWRSGQGHSNTRSISKCRTQIQGCDRPKGEIQWPPRHRKNYVRVSNDPPKAVGSICSYVQSGSLGLKSVRSKDTYSERSKTSSALNSFNELECRETAADNQAAEAFPYTTLMNKIYSSGEPTRPLKDVSSRNLDSVSDLSLRLSDNNSTSLEEGVTDSARESRAPMEGSPVRQEETAPALTKRLSSIKEADASANNGSSILVITTPGSKLGTAPESVAHTAALVQTPHISSLNCDNSATEGQHSSLEGAQLLDSSSVHSKRVASASCDSDKGLAGGNQLSIESIASPHVTGSPASNQMYPASGGQSKAVALEPELERAMDIIQPAIIPLATEERAPSTCTSWERKTPTEPLLPGKSSLSWSEVVSGKRNNLKKQDLSASSLIAGPARVSGPDCFVVADQNPTTRQQAGTIRDSEQVRMLESQPAPEKYHQVPNQLDLASGLPSTKQEFAARQQLAFSQPDARDTHTESFLENITHAAGEEATAKEKAADNAFRVWKSDSSPVEPLQIHPASVASIEFSGQSSTSIRRPGVTYASVVGGQALLRPQAFKSPLSPRIWGHMREQSLSPSLGGYLTAPQTPRTNAEADKGSVGSSNDRYHSAKTSIDSKHDREEEGPIGSPSNDSRVADSFASIVATLDVPKDESIKMMQAEGRESQIPTDQHTGPTSVVMGSGGDAGSLHQASTQDSLQDLEILNVAGPPEELSSLQEWDPQAENHVKISANADSQENACNITLNGSEEIWLGPDRREGESARDISTHSETVKSDGGSVVSHKEATIGAPVITGSFPRTNSLENPTTQEATSLDPHHNSSTLSTEREQKEREDEGRDVALEERIVAGVHEVAEPLRSSSLVAPSRLQDRRSSAPPAFISPIPITTPRSDLEDNRRHGRAPLPWDHPVTGYSTSHIARPWSYTFPFDNGQHRPSYLPQSHDWVNTAPFQNGYAGHLTIPFPAFVSEQTARELPTGAYSPSRQSLPGPRDVRGPAVAFGGLSMQPPRQESFGGQRISNRGRFSSINQGSTVDRLTDAGIWHHEDDRGPTNVQVEPFPSTSTMEDQQLPATHNHGLGYRTAPPINLVPVHTSHQSPSERQQQVELELSIRGVQPCGRIIIESAAELLNFRCPRCDP